MKGPPLHATRIIATLTLAAALTIPPAQSATASESDVQARIDQVIADYPGGVQTAPNEVSWGDGQVILTVVDSDAPSTRAVGSCATGAHCVYSGTSLTGSKLTFSTCTTQSVAPLGGPVKSIANARSSVSVRAYNDLGALGSVAANSWINTSWAMTKIGC